MVHPWSMGMKLLEVSAMSVCTSHIAGLWDMEYASGKKMTGANLDYTTIYK